MSPRLRRLLPFALAAGLLAAESAAPAFAKGPKPAKAKGSGSSGAGSGSAGSRGSGSAAKTAHADPKLVEKEVVAIAKDRVGYTQAQLRALQTVAEREQVVIRMRPTNPEAVALRKGGHPPKPETIKMKTCSEIDLLIGAPPGALGQVLYFDPPKPDFRSPKLKAVLKKAGVTENDALKRYAQRHTEFDMNKHEVEVLVQKGAIRLDGALVVDAKSGKSITGDQDTYSITDTAGRELPAEKKKQVLAAMKAAGLDIEHGAHKDWDVAGITDDHLREKAQVIDAKIRDAHRKTTADGRKGEKLIEASPRGLRRTFDDDPQPSGAK